MIATPFSHRKNRSSKKNGYWFFFFLSILAFVRTQTGPLSVLFLSLALDSDSFWHGMF